MNNDSAKVLDLLEELDLLIENASAIPLTGKIAIAPEDIRDIIKEIKINLPEDIQQAAWIRENAQKIENEAKAEYDRLIQEANEQAEYLTQNHEITLKAKNLAHNILTDADKKSKLLVLNACDSSDRVLFDLLGTVDELNMKYFGEMYTEIEHALTGINDKINQNRQTLREYAAKVQSETEPNED